MASATSLPEARARPLPHPEHWIPESGKLGDPTALLERADTDFREFVEAALGRARVGW